MKKKILLVVVALFAISSLTYADLRDELSENGISFHKEVENENLKSIFKSKFKGLFDDVSEVWVSTNESCDYFYYAEGILDGNFTYEMFKVLPEDVLNETYTYMDVNSTEFQTAVEYCRDYSLFPNCPITYCWYGYDCRAPICGIVDNLPPYLCLIP